jgi:Holliday junction resolvase
MAGASRNKGKAGEREAANLLAQVTGFDVRRRVRQHDGDSDLEGIPAWSIEVKRHATATPGKLAEWWQQAVTQAQRTGTKPLLMYRADRGGWRCVWPADLHTDRLPVTHSIDHTLSASPAAWWAMCEHVKKATSAA